MKQTLTKNAFLDLKHMLSDESFVSILLTDEKEVGQTLDIQEDGSIIIGKTKNKFLNRLFMGEVKMSINDLCLRLINVITGKRGGKNNKAFESLTKDFMYALDNENYSWIISRIFITYRLDFNKDIIDGTERTSKNSMTNKGEEIFVANRGFVVKDNLTGKCYAISCDMNNP